MKHQEDESPGTSNWLVVRDLLEQVLERAKDWPEADCIGDINEMAKHFQHAYPGVQLDLESLKLALHDLNISLERNEHNNKFYYLAKWK